MERSSLFSRQITLGLNQIRFQPSFTLPFGQKIERWSTFISRTDRSATNPSFREVESYARTMDQLKIQTQRREEESRESSVRAAVSLLATCRLDEKKKKKRKKKKKKKKRTKDVSFSDLFDEVTKV